MQWKIKEKSLNKIKKNSFDEKLQKDSKTMSEFAKVF